MDQCVMYSESHMFPYKFVQRALHLKIGQKPISAMYITHVRVCMIDRFRSIMCILSMRERVYYFLLS